MRDQQWLRAAGWARRLSWVSLAWMSGEGILGLVAGLDARSISLLGYTDLGMPDRNALVEPRQTVSYVRLADRR
jgi:hypothetical protein